MLLILSGTISLSTSTGAMPNGNPLLGGSLLLCDLADGDESDLDVVTPIAVTPTLALVTSIGLPLLFINYVNIYCLSIVLDYLELAI